MLAVSLVVALQATTAAGGGIAIDAASSARIAAVLQPVGDDATHSTTSATHPGDAATAWLACLHDVVRLLERSHAAALLPAVADAPPDPSTPALVTASPADPVPHTLRLRPTLVNLPPPRSV